MAEPLARQAPKGVTRRDFVKTAVAAAAAGAAGGIGFAAFQGSAPKLADVPSFDYLGVEVRPQSKAPQGIPLVPITRREDDRLVALPSHLDWYRYCARAEAPGLQDDYESDNLLTYKMPEDRREVAGRLGTWWRSFDGRPMMASDFPDEGDGALAQWRSQGERESNFLGIIVIRVDPARYDGAIRDEFVADGFLGVLALCAHLCCSPTYRLGDTGHHLGHEQEIVCDCHGSWYDPYTIRTYRFPPTG